MNAAQNTTISSNDNRAVLTPEAISEVVSLIQCFDGVPPLPFEGVGLLAVAAAQDAQRRMGVWGAIDNMLSFFGSVSGDRHGEFAVSVVNAIRTGVVDADDEDVRDSFCRTILAQDGQNKPSLPGYCLLQVVHAALWANSNPSPCDHPALNIANELAEHWGTEAAVDFAVHLRQSATKAKRSD